MNDDPLARHSSMAACALALLLCLDGAEAADSGPRHHAEGQYNAADATYTVVKGDDLAAIAERLGSASPSSVVPTVSHPISSSLGQKLAAGSTPGSAPQPHYQYATPMPPGVASPDNRRDPGHGGEAGRARLAVRVDPRDAQGEALDGGKSSGCASARTCRSRTSGR